MDKVIKVFEQMEHPIWIKDDNNKIVFFNYSFKRNFDINENCKIEDLIDYLKNKEKYEMLLYSITRPQNIMKNSFIYRDKIYKYSVTLYNENHKKLFIATVLDVSDIVDTDEKLILRTVVDNIPSLIFYKDEKLRYVGMNKACEEFYSAKGVYDVIGKNDLELPLEKEFIETCNSHDKIVLNSKEPLCIEEKVFMPKTGKYNIYQTIKTPIINHKDEIVGLVGVIRDVTEYKETEEQLTYLSYTDALTSLYNRFYFDKKISKLIKTEKFPIGVIFGDINGLKIVNDTLGHHEGDKFLIAMADCLKACCEDKGIPFRWSGDEFCIILPQSSNEECVQFMAKVNEYCSDKAYKNFDLIISLGHSLLEKDGNINDILAQAEGKVYKQKMLSSKSIRISTLNNLKEGLEEKNVETEAHTERVAMLCGKIGKAMDLDDETIDELVMVARFHDIGKIGIPEHILLKPSKLTDSEFEIMKTHSEKGYRIAILLPELSHIARSILTHHERWDGKGYPLGLKGEEIPLIARIVSIVDSYDAITHSRVYSKAKNKEYAIEELRKCANKQFDPNITELFCKIISNED